LRRDFDPLRGQKSAFTATALDLPYRRLMRDVVLCASESCIDYPAGSARVTASVLISHPPDTAPIEALRHRSIDPSALTAMQHCTTRRQKKRGVSPLG